MKTMCGLAFTLMAILCSAVQASDEEFKSWHKSLDVGGPVTKIFRPQNNASVAGSTSPLQSDDYLGGLNALMDILAQVEEGKRIRAYGSKWSMSNTAYVNDYLIESWGLNYCNIGIDNPDYINAYYQPIRDQLAFVQSGVMIKHLGAALREAGYSLSSMGGSDGQRLGGAIATGTHGSSPLFGAMQEFVRGIHLVISKNEHVFIQRESHAVVTSQFASEFLHGARLIESNDLFDAAVVGLGSFGVVHALLIEVEPLFTLRTRYKVMNYNDVKNVMSSLEVEKLGFDGVRSIPFFLQFNINPYNLKKTFVGVYEKILPESSEMHSLSSSCFEEVDDTAVEDPIQTLLRQVAGKSVSLTFLDQHFNGLFRPIGNFFKRIVFSALLEAGFYYYFISAVKRSGKPMASIFSLQPGGDQEEEPGITPSTEMEIGVPAERVTEVVDIWIKIAQRRPLLHPITVRYVKGSNATIAFTRYNMTATVSMFGPWGRFLASDVEDIFHEIFAAMAATSIPHCWHWGKKQPPTSEWVVDHCLGLTTRNAWMEQREMILTSQAARNMFSNDNLEFLGLHVP
jgi:FAD binding domain